MNEGAFYATIPTSVLHDKSISCFEKLLYCELSSLTRLEGYCWASNNYLADRYDVSPRHISRSISSLQEAGYIVVEIDNKIDRKIFATNKAFNQLPDPQGRTKMSKGVDKNVVGVGQKCLHNINNKYNNINNKKKKNIKKEKEPEGAVRYGAEPKPVETNRTEPKVTESSRKQTRKKNMSEKDFQEFYDLYPLKKSKGAARRKFLSLPFSLKEKIMSAVKLQIEKGDLRHDHAYKKHPSTWLNQECWEDEITEEKVADSDGVLDLRHLRYE